MNTVEIEKLTEILPFLIPLIVVQLALVGYTLWHILTHKTYMRGSRALWIVVVLVGLQFVGPILYFVLGREES